MYSLHFFPIFVLKSPLQISCHAWVFLCCFPSSVEVYTFIMDISACLLANLMYNILPFTGLKSMMAPLSCISIMMCNFYFVQSPYYNNEYSTLCKDTNSLLSSFFKCEDLHLIFQHFPHNCL